MIKFGSDTYFLGLKFFKELEMSNSGRTSVQEFSVLKKSIYFSRGWSREPWISRRARYPRDHRGQARKYVERNLFRYLIVDKSPRKQTPENWFEQKSNLGFAPKQWPRVILNLKYQQIKKLNYSQPTVLAYILGIICWKHMYGA